MGEKKLENLFAETLQGIKGMVDIDTIVGKPIEAEGNVTVIPVSKVAFGFGVGGYEGNKGSVPDSQKEEFTGGSGGGVTITPVAFLVIDQFGVKMINVDSTTPLEKVIEGLPQVVSSVAGIFKK